MGDARANTSGTLIAHRIRIRNTILRTSRVRACAPARKSKIIAAMHSFADTRVSAASRDQRDNCDLENLDAISRTLMEKLSLGSLSAGSKLEQVDANIPRERGSTKNRVNSRGASDASQ
jgi:hypothetical protein